MFPKVPASRLRAFSLLKIKRLSTDLRVFGIDRISQSDERKFSGENTRKRFDQQNVLKQVKLPTFKLKPQHGASHVRDQRRV